MRRRMMVILVAMVGWAFPVACATGAVPEVNLQNAFDKVAKLQVGEALDDFETLRRHGGPEARKAAFGAAIAYLNVQPKTESNLDRAAALLEEVASGGEDDLSAYAMYYRARIEQIHRYEPVLDRALSLYDRLIERFPGHPAAEYGQIKRGTIELFDDSPMAEKRQHLALLESVVAGFKSAQARRDLHLMLAQAYTRLLPDENLALSHLLAADEIGIQSATAKASAWLRIGELAQRAGKTEMVVKYYRRFLETYRRDYRHYTIAQRLKVLEVGVTE